MGKCKYTSIGGQALIEGIMMRGEKTAMAIRKPDGTIDISYMDYTPIAKKYKVLGLPIIRGVVNFVEAMLFGYKALMKSAEISEFIEEDDKKGTEKTEQEKKKENITLTVIMSIASVLAVVLCFVLFLYLPALALDGLALLFSNAILRFAPLIEGIIRLAILVLYMAAVSRMKEIKRVFMYHGAEHKTIFCYEHKKELTVENVREEKRFHPRCGTSFLALMVLVSIIASSVISIVWPTLREDSTIIWVLVKMLLVPFVCGIGYELIKICGKYDNWLTKIISAPGMWFQHITTYEPEDDMIEIAIAAMKEVIPENNQQSDKENDCI